MPARSIANAMNTRLLVIGVLEYEIGRNGIPILFIGTRLCGACADKKKKKKIGIIPYLPISFSKTSQPILSAADKQGIICFGATLHMKFAGPKRVSSRVLPDETGISRHLHVNNKKKKKKEKKKKERKTPPHNNGEGRLPLYINRMNF